MMAEPSHEITQPKEKGEFTVVLQAAGEIKIEVVRETPIPHGPRAEGSERSYRECAKDRQGCGEGTRPRRLRLTSKRWALRSRSSVLKERAS
jgi:hypothetical protein